MNKSNNSSQEKLVRDYIPEIIQASGRSAYFRVASDDAEYKTFLINKLREEVEEFAQEPCLEEMADIMEVLQAIQVVYEFDLQKLDSIKHRKANRNGKLDKRLILTCKK